jgi:hypothetical protein
MGRQIGNYPFTKNNPNRILKNKVVHNLSSQEESLLCFKRAVNL